MPSITRRAVSALLALLVASLTLLGLGSTSAFAAGTAGTAGSRPAAAGKLPPVLRVGTEGVYPPFSYHKGDELTGFDVEYMRALGRKLGVRVQFVEVPWDGMFTALSSGRIDLVANQVGRTPEREKLYDLSNTYIDSTGVVVVSKGNTSIKSLADIKGKRAGENLTSNWSDVARKAGAKVLGVDAMDKAIQNLRQGSVDVVVNDKLAIRNFMASQRNSGGVKVVAETSDRSESALAARKNSGYLPQLNAGIAQLKSDGTTNKLYDKYFSGGTVAPSNWDLVKDNAWPMAWALIKVSLPLTLISFALGLVIALGVAVARLSTNRLASWPARAFISLIRGVPVLVLLSLIYFGLPQLGWKLSPFAAAVVGLTINVAGFAAETIRSVIQSVPRGQWEAANTIGMNYRQSLRRVILPQAARTAIPPLGNTLVGLLKDTSLASTILVVELWRQAQIAAAPTFKFFTLYGLAALYYWIACAALSFLQSRAEARVSRFVA